MAGGMNLKELDNKLRRSFLAIKQDMIQLKNAINLQLRTSTELKEGMKVFSEQFVTKDKLNLIKIKVAELNENFKKVWELEKDIKELDDATIKKAYLEQKIEEVNKDLSDLKKTIEDIKEESVTQKQISSLKEEISTLRDVKDSLILKEFSKKIDAIENEFRGMKAKDFVNKKQVDVLLDDVNREFDKIKEDIDELKQSKTEKAAIEDLDHDVDKKLTDLRDDVEKDYGKELRRIREKLDDIEKNVVDRFREDIGDLKESKSDRAAFDELDHELDRRISDFRDDFEKDYGKEIVRIRNKLEDIEKNLVDKRSFAKAINSIEKGEEYEEVIEAGIGKKAARKVIKRKKRGKGLFILANLLIVVAFLLLLAAVVSFFIDKTTWMDRLAIGAVVAFVIGILMRVIVVLRK